MKFSTISAQMRIDLAQPDQPAPWIPGGNRRDPLADKAFAQHVARRHYWQISELNDILQKTFYQEMDQDAPRSRRRYVDALDFVWLYLNRQGLETHLLAELMELSQALQELDSGTIRPFLRAADVGPGARRLSSDVWDARAWLVMALDYVIDHDDKDQSKAADRLARETATLGKVLAGKGGEYTGKTLVNWLASFRDGTVPSGGARTLFRSRDDLAEMYSRTPKEQPRRIYEAFVAEATMRAIRMMDKDTIAAMMQDDKRRSS